MEVEITNEGVTSHVFVNIKIVYLLSSIASILSLILIFMR
jgi:hypothetical protein